MRSSKEGGTGRGESGGVRSPAERDPLSSCNADVIALADVVDVVAVVDAETVV